MEIVVLNGSPKGRQSVTMQYVAYLEKVYPKHNFNIWDISQRIRNLENDPKAFNQVIDQVRQADAVIWGFPLYILMVHANYKRFIELIWERGVQDAFSGKYAAALSTSIHFYDHTAHNYIHAICDDLDMIFVDSFSADMNDLHEEQGQRKLTTFFDLYLDVVEKKMVVPKVYQPIHFSSFRYQPGKPMGPLTGTDKKILILHDENDRHSNLGEMISRCQDRFSGKATTVNIRELNMKGSCLGCLKCSGNYRCSYTGKDDYIEFYKSTVMTADIIIYAGTLVDRYLSSRWKMFFDRIFFNTHTPVLNGKQVGILVSGPFSQVPNLFEILRGFFEFQGANIVGVVSDEVSDSEILDKAVDNLIDRMVASSQMEYVHPQTFLGVGGMKIFRDDIYGRLRTVFAADHRMYRQMGIYKTFPQNNLLIGLLNTFVAPIVNIPFVRRKFDSMIKKQMVSGFQSVIQKAAPR